MTSTTKCSRVDLIEKRAARIPSLVTDLASTDSAVRTKARKALVAIGKLSVPSLIRLLSHRKPHMRWEAAKALCGIADPLAAAALVNALDDRDGDEVRWLAAEKSREGCNPCWRHCSSGLNHVGFARAPPHLSHFGQKEKARPDSAACIGGSRGTRAGSCDATGRLCRAYRDCESCREDTVGLGATAAVALLMEERCHAGCLAAGLWQHAWQGKHSTAPD